MEHVPQDKKESNAFAVTVREQDREHTNTGTCFVRQTRSVSVSSKKILKILNHWHNIRCRHFLPIKHLMQQ